jgi:hypothetical protein
LLANVQQALRVRSIVPAHDGEWMGLERVSFKRWEGEVQEAMLASLKFPYHRREHSHLDELISGEELNHRQLVVALS